MAIKKTMKKQDVKRNVFPHTQAKLDLFKGYLEHYLRILCHADFCKQINLFDIYCGVGLYEDGKKGSPLLALDCVRNINIEISNNGKRCKPISLTINDYDPKKIENVKNNADFQGIENCSLEYYNKDANEMLELVSSKVSKNPKDHRNLVFIDPYGYSAINKDNIIKLLNNNCSEIILFLPIMQMYRFTDAALYDTENKPHYENLRKFVMSFFGENQQLSNKTIFEYIRSIKEALSICCKYYTCSHYIEREKGSYYALFFIGSNIYGLEKMIETKWKLDPIKGKGFNQKKNPQQLSMFDDEFEEIDNMRELSYLENVLYQAIQQVGRQTNCDVYELTLQNEFLPKHANDALRSLIKQGKIKELNQSQGYGINYHNYKIKKEVSIFIKS